MPVFPAGARRDKCGQDCSPRRECRRLGCGSYGWRGVSAGRDAGIKLEEMAERAVPRVGLSEMPKCIPAMNKKAISNMAFIN